MILSEDGRHTWVGRATDPTPEALKSAGSTMDSLDLAAWLMVTRGAYYDEGEVELFVVRRLTDKKGSLDEAIARWRTERGLALSDETQQPD